MGNAIRIYLPRPYKAAYVFVDGETVTHASEELGFTIGWPKAKLADRAKVAGFKLSATLDIKKPRHDWLCRNPKTKGKN